LLASARVCAATPQAANSTTGRGVVSLSGRTALQDRFETIFKYSPQTIHYRSGSSLGVTLNRASGSDKSGVVPRESGETSTGPHSPGADASFGDNRPTVLDATHTHSHPRLWSRRAGGQARPRSTVLSGEEETIVFAFRRHTLPSLDDCLYALQPTIPHRPRREALSLCCDRSTCDVASHGIEHRFTKINHP
jgi:hypothetical protein